MDRNLTPEEQEKIINFGAFGYQNEEMSIILGWDTKKEMSDKNSEFSKLYEKGKVVSEYLLMTKVFEMAKAGDLKALEKYTIMKRLRGSKR
jgi:hypothetical protein